MEKTEVTSKVLEQILLKIKEDHPSVGAMRCIGLFAAVELAKDKITKEELEEQMVILNEDFMGLKNNIYKIATQKRSNTELEV